MSAPLRILYVDDSKYDRELVRDALEQERHAFQLVEAASRDAFQNLLAAGEYDLVLSDCNILGYEGLQVFDAVKSKDKRIPVVIVTGTGTEEIAVEAMRRGVSDYVIKTPHHIRRLPFTLRSAIHQARLREAHRQSIEALRDSENRLKLALWAARQGLFDLDVSSQTVRLTLKPSTPLNGSMEMTPLRFSDLRRRIHPADHARVWRALRDHIAGHLAELRAEFRMKTVGPEWRWILAVGMTVDSDDTGMPTRILGIHTDITSQKSRDEQLLLAASVFENSREIIVIADAQQRIVSANQACCELTGYRVEQLWGCNMAMLRSSQHDAAFFDLLDERLREAGYWQGELWAKRSDGEVFPTLEVISQVKNGRGDVTHCIHIATDISKDKQAEEKMRRLAFFDPLTNLPNRAVFADRVEQALFTASRARSDVVLMFIDLDHFKNINDTLGHLVGDALLREVARRMQCAVREMDTICRLGGDEFVVLLPKGGDRAAVRVAEKLRDMVCQPFATNGYTVQVSCSIGISVAPKDGLEYDALLANADTALYKAKAAGRNTFLFYGSEMNSVASERMVIEHELHLALKSSQLTVHYQPQIDLQSGALVGLEALVRWDHPQRGLQLPPQFLPTAAEGSLIARIDDWMIEEVCRQLAQWREMGITTVPVTINISARSIVEGMLLTKLDAALAAHGLASAGLAIDVTEDTLAQFADGAMAMLAGLRERGIAVCLDDFGTGLINLSQLKAMPFDMLKLAPSLLADLDTNANTPVVLRSLIQFCQALGFKVLAEGVETAPQRTILIQLGCDRLQGFVDSPAVSSEAAAVRLQAVNRP